MNAIVISTRYIIGNAPISDTESFAATDELLYKMNLMKCYKTF